MSGSENISRPSADVAREKTEASIRAVRQYGKPKDSTAMKAARDADKCDAVKNMVSFEDPINNVSPNATNLSR